MTIQLTHNLLHRSRLPSLYSDLTVQRTTNPDGYAANVTAWQTALKSAALARQLPGQNRLILDTSSDLLDALANPEYGRPSGLGAVIDDSVRNGKMIDLHDFQVSERSIYNRSWVPSPWAILQWSLRQIGLVSGGSYDVSGGRLRSGQLVLVAALEEVTKQILAMRAKHGQSLTDRVMTREAFVRDYLLPIQQDHDTSMSDSWSPQDLEVLLRHLHRDKQILTYTSHTVKFKSPTATFLEPITPEDTGIANLKQLISTLESQISTLQSRISTLQATAQSAVKTGSKHTALTALRSKKLAQTNLTRRLDTLHQLEQVYTSIEEASDQVAVVEAMRESARILKSLNARVGGVERVDEVMDRLREEMERSEEVGAVLREPLDAASALEVEGEVDEELEKMEREQKEEKEAEETRRRLEQLDKVKDQQPGAHQDEMVEGAVKRLSHMSIEDNTPKPATEVGEEPSHRVPQEERG